MALLKSKYYLLRNKRIWSRTRSEIFSFGRQNLMASSTTYHHNLLPHNSKAITSIPAHHKRSFSSVSVSSQQQIPQQSGQPEQQQSEDIDIKIVEVGARDGLQSETQIVSTKNKVELIMKLVRAGCQSIEAASFVAPKWVPTMADSSEVMKELYLWKKQQQEQLQLNVPTFSCLVPNLKGLQRALEATDGNVDEVAIFGSASEVFSKQNINCTIEESMNRFRSVTEYAEDHNIPVRGYVSCIVGCPYQGYVAPSEVARVTEYMLDLGCYEISLGDTIGVGTVGSTTTMLEEVLPMFELSSSPPKTASKSEKSPSPNLAVHFHDTYGQALANIHVAIQKGITTVDSSVGGLGGCPYADGASGNVATEDVVYMLHGMGLKTGINLERLIDAGTFIHSVLGRTTRSKVAIAMEAKRRKLST